MSNPPVLPKHQSRTPFGGCLTPRLSVLLSAPRSRARNDSRDPVNRRSERRSDRDLMARSIDSPNERAADASISAVEIRGEQEGEHRGEHPLRARCSPLEHLDSARIAVDANAVRRLNASDKFNERCELLDACDGRRSVPPAKDDDVDEVVNRSTVA